MKRRHGYIGCVRDAARGYEFWQARCLCGYATQAEHVRRSYALGALMEHLVRARADELVRSAS